MELEEVQSDDVCIHAAGAGRLPTQWSVWLGFLKGS